MMVAAPPPGPRGKSSDRFGPSKKCRKRCITSTSPRPKTRPMPGCSISCSAITTCRTAPSRTHAWRTGCKQLPPEGLRDMCSWGRFCTFAREPERRKVGIDARVSVAGVRYEVDPDLAGETVIVWFGLFLLTGGTTQAEKAMGEDATPQIIIEFALDTGR